MAGLKNRTSLRLGVPRRPTNTPSGRLRLLCPLRRQRVTGTRWSTGHAQAIEGAVDVLRYSGGRQSTAAISRATIGEEAEADEAAEHSKINLTNAQSVWLVALALRTKGVPKPPFDNRPPVPSVGKQSIE
jgi:hypothetical protein